MELSNDWVDSTLRSLGVRHEYEIPTTLPPKDILSLGTKHILHKLVTKKIPGGKQLAELVKIVPRYEKLMFMTSPHFADHFEHCIKVALVGEWLLRKRFLFGTKNQRLVENASSLMRCEPKRVEEIWWTSALLHDFAYPANIVLGAARNLSQEIENSFRAINLRCSRPEISFGRETRKLADRLLSFAKTKLRAGDFELFRNGIDSSFLHAPSEQAADVNHGLIGSLAAVSLLEGFSGRLEASLAIALHDTKNVRIDFRDLPISFLLVLCDEIQEFDRIRRKPEAIEEQGSPSFTPEYKEYKAVKKVELEADTSEICISMVFDKKANTFGFDHKRYVLSKIAKLARLSRGMKGGSVFPETTFTFFIDGNLYKSFEIKAVAKCSK